MLLPLSTTWKEVEERVLPRLAALSPAAPQTTPLDATRVQLPHVDLILHWKARLQQLPAGGAAPQDTLLTQLQHAFYRDRCGVLVVVRQGALAWMAPFANRDYTNGWPGVRLEVPQGDPDASPAQYQAAKARLAGTPPEPWLPTSRWWLNGRTVCNVMPRDVWGDAHLAEVRDMLAYAAEVGGGLPDCHFFLNKRDGPVNPRGRWAAAGGTPTLSYYSGPHYDDLLMPLTEDWRVAVAGPETGQAPPPPLDHPDVAPKAVWRGGATGAGVTPDTNPRLALVTLAATPAAAHLVDARLTHWNSRDKVTRTGEGGVPHVSFLAPSLVLPPSLQALAPTMSLPAQTAAYRYVLYVDGHSAANRYGALMRCGRPILRVASRPDQPAGDLWLLPGLHSWRVTTLEDPPPPSTPDHLLVDADLSNLAVTVEWLNAHLDVAERVARAAAARAPTKALIAGTWLVLLSMVARAQQQEAEEAEEAEEEEETAPARRPWFSPWDPRYARLVARPGGFLTHVAPPHCL